MIIKYKGLLDIFVNIERERGLLIFVKMSNTNNRKMNELNVTIDKEYRKMIKVEKTVYA